MSSGSVLMKYLFTIQRYTKHYANLVSPLQKIVVLLRKVGVSVHKVTVKKIDRMQNQWTDMFHKCTRFEMLSQLSSQWKLKGIYREEEHLNVSIGNYTKKLDVELPIHDG